MHALPSLLYKISKHPSTSYPAAKHPKDNKLKVSCDQEKPVIYVVIETADIPSEVNGKVRVQFNAVLFPHITHKIRRFQSTAHTHYDIFINSLISMP